GRSGVELAARRLHRDVLAARTGPAGVVPGLLGVVVRALGMAPGVVVWLVVRAAVIRTAAVRGRQAVHVLFFPLVRGLVVLRASHHVAVMVVLDRDVRAAVLVRVRERDVAVLGLHDRRVVLAVLVEVVVLLDLVGFAVDLDGQLV